MKRGFGQFKRRVRDKRDMELSSAELAIVKAFDQGSNAGRSDEPRTSPYMPSSEEEKHLAWLAGYDEHATRYVIAFPPLKKGVPQQ